MWKNYIKKETGRRITFLKLAKQLIHFDSNARPDVRLTGS